MRERRHFTRRPSELRGFAKQPELVRIPPRTKPEMSCNKKRGKVRPCYEGDLIHCSGCGKRINVGELFDEDGVFCMDCNKTDKEKEQ